MHDNRRRPRDDDEDDLFRGLSETPGEAAQPPESSSFHDVNLRDLGPASAKPAAARAPARDQQRPPEATGIAAKDAPHEGEPLDDEALDNEPLLDDFTDDEDLGDLPNVSPGAPRQQIRLRDDSRPRRHGGPSRILLVAVCVVLAGAAFLFWPRGHQAPPLGIGEHTSVVTGKGPAARPTTTPVDIGSQVQPLVPEGATPPKTAAASTAGGASGVKPPTTAAGASPGAGTAGAKPAADAPTRPAATQTTTSTAPATSSAPAGTTTPTGSSERPATATAPGGSTALAAGGPQPGTQGLWAVQLGAFSSEDRARSLLSKVQAQGLKPTLKTTGTAGGKLVYKVWIGYFGSRGDAAEYARRQARALGSSAQPVHR